PRSRFLTHENTRSSDLRPVPGYPGYFADREGGVWSRRADPWKRLSHLVDKDGYQLVHVKRGLGRKAKERRPVHQLVALAFIGPKPDPSLHTRHLNCVKSDNRPENLAYGTAAEN